MCGNHFHRNLTYADTLISSHQAIAKIRWSTFGDFWAPSPPLQPECIERFLENIGDPDPWGSAINPLRAGLSA